MPPSWGQGPPASLTQLRSSWHAWQTEKEEETLKAISPPLPLPALGRTQAGFHFSALPPPSHAFREEKTCTHALHGRHTCWTLPLQ